MQLEKTHFDIIIIAGQSNAEGNGIGRNLLDRIVFHNHYEMIDANPYYFDESDPTDIKLVCTLPVVTKIRPLQEKLVGDIFMSDLSISFVQNYIEKGYLKKGRKILVVKAAVGGSGFSKKQQGYGNFLYERLVAMTDQALSLNKNNRLVAFLWHQGEHDAYENLGKSPTFIYEFYKEQFLKQTTAFLERYSQFDIPVITGGFCKSWRNLPENIAACEAVEKALVDAARQLGKASFVPLLDLKSNMEVIPESQDNIHFARESILEIGKRYFARWENIVNIPPIQFQKGQWIWAKNSPEIDDYAEFKASFTVDNLQNQFFLHIASDSVYALYLNDELVTAMRCSDYPHYKYYDRIRLYPQLGENELRIQCWHFGVNSSIYIADTHGVIFELRDCHQEVITYSSALTLSRVMNEFKNNYQKVITSQQGFSFFYDATVTKNTFQSSEVVKKTNIFHLRRIPPMTFDSLNSSKIMEKDDSILIDLTKVSAGFPMFVIDSPIEQTLLIAYGEHLIDDGNVRRIIGDRDFSFEIKVQPGQNQISNPLKRFGTRYLQIYYKKKITVHEFVFYETVAPQVTRSFNYQDQDIQLINKIAIDTLKACLHEHYEDSPWREQALYALDSRNQMLCGYLAFEGFTYQRHNLVQIAQGLNAHGLLDITSPCGIDLAIPSFSLYYIKAVREYLDYSGDVSILLEVSKTLESIIEFFLSRLDEKEGLIPHLKKPFWNFYEWNDFLDNDEEIAHQYTRHGYDLVINALLCLAIEDFNHIFKTKYDYRKLKENIERVFFSVEKGVFKLYSDTDVSSLLGNALGVLLGFEHQKLVNSLQNPDGYLGMTLSMRWIYYDALLKLDQNHATLIIEDIKKRYLKMVEEGATTFFETEKGAADFDGAGSLCHGWSAIPIYYFDLILRKEGYYIF